MTTTPTTTPTPRADPLWAALAGLRGHVEGILDGLDEAALHRAVLPSGWSFLAMIRHLTGMERFWFVDVLGGVPWTAPGGSEEDEWRVAPEESAAAILDAYRAQTADSDRVLASLDLDDAPAWWPEDLFGDWRLDTVRAVVLHVITETACHAGHLDAARELVDGRQWLVL